VALIGCTIGNVFNFFDTHCHIHEPSFPLPADEVVERAATAGVTKLMCVGTSTSDSKDAINFANKSDTIWASVGVHPSAAKELRDKATYKSFASLVKNKKVKAIGECGLDYFYNHTSKEDQEYALRKQFELAAEYNLPMIFHVREAFEDFWKIYDDYPKITGVIHSFTATKKELNEASKRDLYIGLNGIMTFTKNGDQIEAAREVPLSKLVLETDAPFLTPNPLRGKINEPKNVVLVGDFLSQLRGEHLEQLAIQTTKNAERLFKV